MFHITKVLNRDPLGKSVQNCFTSQMPTLWIHLLLWKEGLIKSDSSQSQTSTVPQRCLDSCAVKHRFGLDYQTGGVCMCKDDKVLTALQMEMVCPRLRFWRFWATSDSEWVLLELLDESGSKFWIQNTCGKVKSDFWNRLELQNANRHFFWVTL